MRIARWQLLVLILLGTGAIWTVFALEIARMQEDESRIAEWNIRFQAQALAENSSNSIERINELLLSLRDEWDGNSERFKYLVESRQAYMADIAFQVAVIDARGFLAYSNLQSTNRPTYLGDRMHFRVHREGGGDQLYISDPVLGKVSQRWTIQFTRPIYRHRQFAGVLVISVPPQLFNEAHRSLLPRAGAQALIARTDGTPLAGAPLPAGDRHADATGTERLHMAPFDMPNPPMAGFVHDPARNGQPAMLRGYARLPQYDLLVVVSEPMAAAMANYVRQRNAAAGGALLFSLLLLTSAALVIRSREAEHQAREAVMLSEAILASAVDALGQGFVVYGKDDRLIYCNERYRQFYPKSCEAIQPGVRFDDLLRYGLARAEYPEAIGREDEWLQERMRRHLQGQHDGVQQTSDQRWLRVLERQTAEGYNVGLRLDITELIEAHHAAEVALTRAREASQSKSTFLSNISHELRTPLSGVLGFAALLGRSKLDAHQREQLGMLQDSAERLHVLVSNLLDVTALEGGALTLHESPFSPATLLQESLRSAAEHHRGPVALSSRVPGVLPAVLIGDRGRIRQVLMQLLDNARKFTTAGEIVLSAWWTPDVTEGSASGRLTLKVSDTGTGIAPELRSTLLEPFSTSSQTRPGIADRHGLGLGLALANAIVVRMRGELTIDSQPGSGTTVSMTLPLVAGSELAPGQAGKLP